MENIVSWHVQKKWVNLHTVEMDRGAEMLSCQGLLVFTKCHDDRSKTQLEEGKKNILTTSKSGRVCMWVINTTKSCTEKPSHWDLGSALGEIFHVSLPVQENKLKFRETSCPWTKSLSEKFSINVYDQTCQYSNTVCPPVLLQHLSPPWGKEQPVWLPLWVHCEKPEVLKADEDIIKTSGKETSPWHFCGFVHLKSCGQLVNSSCCVAVLCCFSWTQPEHRNNIWLTIARQ